MRDDATRGDGERFKKKKTGTVEPTLDGKKRGTSSVPAELKVSKLKNEKMACKRGKATALARRPLKKGEKRGELKEEKRGYSSPEFIPSSPKKSRVHPSRRRPPGLGKVSTKKEATKVPGPSANASLSREGDSIRKKRRERVSSIVIGTRPRQRPPTEGIDVGPSGTGETLRRRKVAHPLSSTCEGKGVN